MEQFYTKQVSKEVFKALLNKEYPVENTQKIPTYAEVLDWLLNKDIEITIFQDRDRNYIGLTDIKGRMSIGDDIEEKDFISTLDKAVLFVLDYV